jgi:calcineurin-like phosphoesterase family protein
MLNYWFTSDTHFCHANIIKHCNRPFTDEVEMNEVLIDNWNKCVKPGDQVYHLGDFCLASRDKAAYIKRRLNGYTHFIKGNHDDAAKQIKNMFVWYKDVADITIHGQRIFLSHYAHRVWNKSHRGVWHLYGHSHGSLPDDPTSLSFDVGVDCHDFRPICYDEVKAIMSKKNYKPVDHHEPTTEPKNVTY